MFLVKKGKRRAFFCEKIGGTETFFDLKFRTIKIYLFWIMMTFNIQKVVFITVIQAGLEENIGVWSSDKNKGG